jgi:glycosyltransferase involved in cell wall biosynthesis
MMVGGVSDLPRLLFCCFDVIPGPSAISRRLTEYVKGLSERFQVVCLTVKTPDHPHIEKYQGARLLRVPVGSGDLTAQIQAFDRAVRRQLESEEYLLVHFFDPFGGYALAEKHGELGYKLVYDASVFPSVDLPAAQPGGEDDRRLIARARRQELFCLMNSDAVVVASPLTREWVAGLGVERDHVHVLRAPIDLTPYAPAVMGVPDAVPMKLIHLGSLAGTHGLMLLLEALAIANRSAATSLSIVGPPSPGWRARLEEKVVELGLTGKVDFQAPVAHDDLFKVLAAADVGALCAEDDERNRVVGAPLSRLGEYLAAGRPVIAADVPAVRALAPDDAVAWYQPGDAASLGAAISALAGDPARRVTMGAAARVAAGKSDAMLIRADLVAVYTAITGTVVPRVADDESDHNEVTQLGRSLDAESSGEITQAGAKAPVSADDSSPGTNKVQVAMDNGREGTDPAVGRPDSSTDVRNAEDRPAVMGVPLREPGPPIAEHPPLPALAAIAPSVPEAGSAADQIVREFEEEVVVASSQATAPPVMPEGDEPLTLSTSLPSAPPMVVKLLELPPMPMSSVPTAPMVPVVPAPVPIPLPVPRSFSASPVPFLPPAPSLPSAPPSPSKPIAPIAMPAMPPPLPLRSGSSGVQRVLEPAKTAPVAGDGGGERKQPPPPPSASSSSPALKPPPVLSRTSGLIPPPPPPPPLPSRNSGVIPPPFEEKPLARVAPPPTIAPVSVEEIADDEVHEIGDDDVQPVEPSASGDVEVIEGVDESVTSVDTDGSLPPSAINPWLAQLVHGYCPPGSDLFNRPVPPTTMPGRD